MQANSATHHYPSAHLVVDGGLQLCCLVSVRLRRCLGGPFSQEPEQPTCKCPVMPNLPGGAEFEAKLCRVHTTGEAALTSRAYLARPTPGRGSSCGPAGFHQAFPSHMCCLRLSCLCFLANACHGFPTGHYTCLLGFNPLWLGKVS